MNYTLSEIARICGGTFTGGDVRVSDVVTDSRNCGVPAAPLFVAMRGARHDSHDFIGEMYAAACGPFWSNGRSRCATGRGMSWWRTPSMPCSGWLPTGAAASAARWWASQVRTAKTVVKEWIAQTAPDGVKLFRSPRSYNSQLGAALSLLMIEGDERYAVIEAGISLPARWHGWSG